MQTKLKLQAVANTNKKKLQAVAERRTNSK
jgi:hypothetical protein